MINHNMNMHGLDLSATLNNIKLNMSYLLRTLNMTFSLRYMFQIRYMVIAGQFRAVEKVGLHFFPSWILFVYDNFILYRKCEI